VAVETKGGTYLLVCIVYVYWFVSNISAEKVLGCMVGFVCIEYAIYDFFCFNDKNGILYIFVLHKPHERIRAAAKT
jgi:hypothetical protein